MHMFMWHPHRKEVASCLLQLLNRIDADETLTCVGWLGTHMQPSPYNRQLVRLHSATTYWIMPCFLMLRPVMSLIDVIFLELSRTRRYAFWWHRVISLRNAVVSTVISSVSMHYTVALAFSWAAQISRGFAEHGKSSPLVASVPIEVRPGELLQAFQVHLCGCALGPLVLPWCGREVVYILLLHQVCPDH